MLSSDFSFLPPASIQVEREDRQRRKVSTEGLIDSVRRMGIMQPIIVRREGLVLVAGERRLTCALELQLPTVPVRYVDQLTPIQLQLIELDENLKRSDLTWQDSVMAMGRVHQLLTAQAPEGEWNLSRSAEVMGYVRTTLSTAIKVFEGMDQPGVREAGTQGEAYNILRRREQRAGGAALDELLNGAAPKDADVEGLPLEPLPPRGAPVVLPDFGPPLAQTPSAPVPLPAALATHSPMLAKTDPMGPAAPALPSGPIFTANFLDWAPVYEGPKFNFIHCDFPYGVNMFGGEQGGGSRHGDYEDTPEVYQALVRCLCLHMNRLASVNCHIMFWFSEKHRDWTLATFRELAPSVQWTPFPLIWHKTDNAGIAGDVKRHPRHVYETALFGHRGGRNLAKVKGDCYGAPTDRANKIHPSVKPEPMLRHFFEMMVDDHTEMLDPTCGSGAALRAAESLRAKRVVGLEMDESYAEAARVALRNARTLRGL